MRRMLGLLICVAAVPAAAQYGIVPPRSPAPAGPPEVHAEYLQQFDPKTVQVAWRNSRWLLVTSTGEVVKDFGVHEQEARQALHIIHEMGLTHRGVIGAPTPVMEYWLAEGKAPRGVARAGLRATALTPSALEVAQMQGQWIVRDRARVLFNFGTRPEDARQALAVIRKYQFDQIGTLGQVAPSMYVFMCRGLHDGSPTMAATRGTGSGRVLNTPQFPKLAKTHEAKPKQQLPPATENLSVAGVASPVVSPLANRATERLDGGMHDFHWQAKPGQKDIVPQGERTPFDWRRANVIQENGEWRIKVGSYVLARFGPSSHDARMAMAALRHYRFTEQNHLGGDKPYLTYYIANNSAPRGLMLGMPAEEFAPEKLELRQVAHGYALCQGTRIIVQLRDRQEDGRKLLESIQRTKCDRVCRLGGEPGQESMTLLVRSR